jgi:hypothetical protein
VSKGQQKPKDIYFKALVYGLFAPAVVDRRWMEVPEHLKILGKGHRMLNSLQCVRDEIATEFDALIYLHTASLSVPFNTTWFNIYVYLFRKFFPEHAKVINLPEVESLDAYETSQLNDLRKWIFRQQMKNLKERKLI